jgi:hypothetical protein
MTVTYTRDEVGPEQEECRWFLLCDNVATTAVRHPILGLVPTCARCAARVARNVEEARNG